MLIALASWLNRHRQAVIEYLIGENVILKEQLGKKRPKLTDAQLRRMASLGKTLGRKILGEIACIVTPDTILAWHRKLITRRWTFSRKGPGRPHIKEEIAKLIVKMAL